MGSVSSFFMNYEKMLPKRCQRQSQPSKSMDFSGVFYPVQIIPTQLYCFCPVSGTASNSLENTLSELEGLYFYCGFFKKFSSIFGNLPCSKRDRSERG